MPADWLHICRERGQQTHPSRMFSVIRRSKLVRCVWHIIKYQPTRIEHNPRHMIRIGTFSVLQSSAQYVHKGQQSACGGPLAEAHTDGSSMNETVRVALVVNHHSQNEKAICSHRYKISGQQHHLCCWYYNHNSGTGHLVTLLGPVSPRLMTLQFRYIVNRTQKLKSVNYLFCCGRGWNFVWNFKSPHRY